MDRIISAAQPWDEEVENRNDSDRPLIFHCLIGIMKLY